MQNSHMCRVCLNTDVQHVVKSPQLQETYEKLTSVPTDMRPLLLCYICFAQLKSSRRFMLKCLKAEELYTQMMDPLLTEDGVLDLIIIGRSAFKQLTISSVERIIFDSTVQNDVIIGFETLITYEDDVKIEEQASPEELSETTNSIHSEPDNEQNPSDSGDDVPLNNIETSAEQEAVSVKQKQQDRSWKALQGPAYSANSGPDNEQSQPDSGDNMPLNNIKKNIETATKQEEVRICEKQVNGFNKGPIAKKPNHNPEINKSTHFQKNGCTNSDITRNEAIKSKHDDEIKNQVLNQYIESNSKTNLEKKNMCQQSLLRDLLQGFTVKSDLVRHERIHTGEKPYVCNVCNKGFTVKSGLVLHGRIHTGEKPYVCNVCNKGFTGKSGLVMHGRIHTSEKPYVCNVCNKGFTEKSKLVNHKRIHTGEKPYVCNVCNKGFTAKSSLVIHGRIHISEKPYVCNVCNKGFIRKSYLIYHKRNHTAEKPYVCDVCMKGLAQKSSLIRHIRTHHLR